MLDDLNRSNRPEAKDVVELEHDWEGASHVLGPTHPRTINNLGSYALALDQVQKYAQAEALLVTALAACRPLTPDNVPSVRRLLYWLGNIYLDDEKPSLAEPLFQELLEGSRQETPPVPLFVAHALEGLGESLAELGPAHSAEAETDLREDLSIEQSVDGTHALTTARVAAKLARLLNDTGRPAEATALLKQYEALASSEPSTTPSAVHTTAALTGEKP